MTWPVQSDDTTAPRVGRRRATNRDDIARVAIELFGTHGFGAVSVDDVARAAGISRRSLFRYYSSKNAIMWGDFETHLGYLGRLLDDVGPDVPLHTALRDALLAFNDFDPGEAALHRQRMRVILETAELQAYSMTMYADWRQVIARFVATRRGLAATGLVPQTTAWTMLGVALSAYEHWVADDAVTLADALRESFDVVGIAFEQRP